MQFENLLAKRTENMGASAIRETLKVISQPGMISLGGGMPAPESFPMEIINQLCSRVLEIYSSDSLQYGPSEGFAPLRETLTEYLAEKGVSATSDDIIITSGSQGALDTIGKILIYHGDKIAVEAPTYLGAISAFNPYEPKYISLVTDDNGLVPEALDEMLSETKVKFIYLIPTFQNPTGRTIPLERRRRIADIIIRHNALLVEDDPYNALRFRGTDIPPIKTMAPDNVVYISTFSKILSPGMRLGFCVAPKLIKDWMVLAKQGVDLHTNTFSQAVASEYLAGGYLKKHLPLIVDVYRRKHSAMLTALDKYFPDELKWSRPDGGMFIWAVGPSYLDTEALYWKAIKKNVAYIPGKYFYTEEKKGNNAMRLNFTMADDATLDRAVKILADVLREEMNHESVNSEWRDTAVPHRTGTD